MFGFDRVDVGMKKPERDFCPMVLGNQCFMRSTLRSISLFVVVSCSGCGGPIGTPIAPVAPEPGLGIGFRNQHFMIQSSGGAELLPAERHEEGDAYPAHRRGFYSLDLRYLTTLRSKKWELGLAGYGTNLGLIDWDIGGSVSLRRTFLIGTKFRVAPRFGFGTGWYDVSVPLSVQMNTKLWWAFVPGIRAAARGGFVVGASGCYHRLRPGFGIQYMAGLKCHFRLDYLYRMGYYGDEDSWIRKMSVPFFEDPRMVSPFLSIGPAFSF